MPHREMSCWKTIKCKCGRRLRILKPFYAKRERFSKSHIHCEPCNLEWHLDLSGRIYKHVWRINGVDVHTLNRRRNQEVYEGIRQI